MGRFTIILPAAILAACGPAGCRTAPDAGAPPQAVSLLGEPLYAPELDAATAARRREQLAEATARLDADPDGEADLIWVGRRLAYLGLYDEAIDVYTQGLTLHPDSYRIRRHRGHRYITIRELDKAVADLRLAAELSAGLPDAVEADGLPNARNIPTSTTGTNIYYHLGLALYLQGRFEPALDAYRQCMTLSTNDDMRCATAYWLYLTLRRLGREAEARAVLEPITPDMDLVENFAYHELLLLFKGDRTVNEILHSEADAGPVGKAIDDATRGYGIGAWHMVNGRDAAAREIFELVVRDTAWPAFGHIAAEAELARRQE